jgi:hypothetical protein
MSESHRAYKRRLKNKWIAFFKKHFGDSPVCQVCNKTLSFQAKSTIDAVHFDHRYEGLEDIKDKPIRWIGNHACNSTNQNIFLSCNFGVLCHQCNIHLPTVGREEWIMNIVRYIRESAYVN